MEKWKRKIIRSMYKEWISNNNISANDILEYFINPKNYFEITNLMMDLHEKSLKFRLIKFFWPIYEYLHKDELKNELDE